MTKMSCTMRPCGSSESILKIMNSTDAEDNGEQNLHQCLGKDYCLHCDDLFQKLIITERKYQKLKNENYAGELTIYVLKQKNRQLLHKISKNQTQCNIKTQQIRLNRSRSKITKNIRKNTKSKTKMQNTEQNKEQLMDTFNPSKLRKTLSQCSKLQNNCQNQQEKQNIMFEHNFKINNQIANRQGNQYKNYVDLSPNKPKKQFNLADLKKKAELRLIQIKKQKNRFVHEPETVANKRKVNNSTQQFKLY